MRKYATTLILITIENREKVEKKLADVGTEGIGINFGHLRPESICATGIT